MKEELIEVVKHNQSVQERMRELNIRAGKEVFPVMDKSEWKSWLSEKLGPSVINQVGIVDFEVLKLPELDQEIVKQILVDNPDTVLVEGQTYQILYRDSYCQIEMTEEVVRRSVLLDKIVLSSGRNVRIVAGSCYDDSISALVIKLEENRIKRAWQEVRSKWEMSKASRSIYWFREVFAKGLKPVVVIIKDNKNGEEIFAYPGFFDDNDSNRSNVYYGIKLFETQEEAIKSSKHALEIALKYKVLVDVINLNDFDADAKLKQNIEKQIDGLIIEKAQQLALSLELINENTLTELKKEFEEEVERIKEEFGGEYFECKGLIEGAQIALDIAIESINEDDRDLVESEIEQVRGLIHNAEDLIKFARYDEVKENLQVAEKFSSSLRDILDPRITERDQAEVKKDAVRNFLHDIYYCNNKYQDATEEEKWTASELRDQISQAWNKKSFQDVISFSGEAEKFILEVDTRLQKKIETERIIRKHINANYSTTDYYDLENPPIDSCISVYSDNEFFSAIHSTSGEEFVRFMETRLDGKVVCWLEAKNYSDTEVEFYIRVAENLELTEDNLAKLELEVVKTWTPPTVGWMDMGKRWWRCPEGHSERALKNASEVVCSICGATHQIK